MVSHFQTAFVRKVSSFYAFGECAVIFSRFGIELLFARALSMNLRLLSISVDESSSFVFVFPLAALMSRYLEDMSYRDIVGLAQMFAHYSSMSLHHLSVCYHTWIQVVASPFFFLWTSVTWLPVQDCRTASLLWNAFPCTSLAIPDVDFDSKSHPSRCIFHFHFRVEAPKCTPTEATTQQTSTATYVTVEATTTHMNIRQRKRTRKPGTDWPHKRKRKLRYTTYTRQNRPSNGQSPKLVQ